MAQRVSIQLVDDIDGGDAAETVTFALDGTSYEIDLSATNAAALRDAFGPWIGHARKLGRRTPAVAPRRGASSGDTKAIREWARANGFDVPERGRFSAELRAAYAAANS